VADFYKESVVRFKSLLNADFGTDSLTDLENGKVPKLKALHLHNGTVYKWNRVCYGITAGKPHIRIENRYLPSGPTTVDEIANMMFWVGLMRARPKQYNDIRNKIDFKDVKSNFYNAARYGTAAQFYWDGRLVPCKELLLDELLPMAYRGLYAMNVMPEDAEKYLSVIENRIKTRNGARWIVESFRKLKKEHKTHDVLHLLTAAMYQHERKGYAIDAWELARGNEFGWDVNQRKVRQLMNTDIISAQGDDSAELVLKIMYWKNIHHLPIMDAKMELIGLLSWTDVKHFMENPKSAEKSIKKIMRTQLITIDADATVKEAKALMATNQINCLPVTGNHKLLGILTTKDV
jgi:CBS domain-containing protein